jgi:hypothetical protein
MFNLLKSKGCLVIAIVIAAMVVGFNLLVLWVGMYNPELLP